ncbi:hypothetical protein [Bythopirellula polymerisocia]|uniref:Uncharacterized protein n=1 Tax=Bythopirellula polymerisocia TaxID=2528003 RepID=A0A5C6CYD1_9BACT|nr:hypothetical protein [Bythopirellula polymerisocia]TWU28584.1 hypothetical protein Pla144_18750 [Bythopirellula polymerisocia]
MRQILLRRSYLGTHLLILGFLLFANPAWSEIEKAEEHSTDLSGLAAAASQDHRTFDNDRFEPTRQELINSSAALERALVPGSNLSKNWKRYLKWDLLTPQLQEGAKIDRDSLENLKTVLRRFRANHPGLELPVFTRTAAALDRYQEVAFWNALAARRDTAPIYDSYMKSFAEQLRRHKEAPTMETTRQVGQALGTVGLLGDSPQVVQAVHEAYSRPNVWADVSTSALNQLAAPVCQMRPVRDCILGATVRGTAITSGLVRFYPLESSNRIEMDIHLAGVINSQTQAFKKPVRVSSSGTTNYTASKRLYISDDQFTTMGPQVSARTHTHIRSVQKTGGRFGKRLVEKIAWKKVYEKKSQSEWIAARHAEQKIADSFNQQVVEALSNGRVNYEGKLRAPLTRVGLLTEAIHLSSNSNAIHTQAVLASHKQITTDALPPGKLADNDVTVQLHETAVNNFLPVVLAGAVLRQEREDERPKLEGDVPPWLKELSEKSPQEIAENVQSAAAEIAPELVAEPEKKSMPFRPWYFKFNTEHPASVSFEDQKLTLRMRLAELQASEVKEDEPLKNWDFIVTYKVIQDGNEVLLKREGDIEAFPTGFDPRWDDKLTGEQVGLRSNLAKNLNKRAAEGQGFPAEIPIPAIKLPQQNDGNQLTLQLAQLDCDNGWLTIGYHLP